MGLNPYCTAAPERFPRRPRGGRRHNGGSSRDVPALDLHSQRIAHFPALTGLRGVAACAVLAFHLWQFVGGPRLWLGAEAWGYPAHALAATGFLGVDLFFVLSGFLLGLPFLAAVRGERPWPRLPTYLVRRARRVLPALWAQIALLALLWGAFAGAVPFDLRTALLHATFLQHWVTDPGQVNPVYWTLPVEWWFYFLLPFAALAFRWVRWWLLLALVVAGVVLFRLQCHAWLADGLFGVWSGYGQIMLLRARFDQFFLGLLAAWFHLGLPGTRWGRAVAVASAIAGLVALAPSLALRGDLFVRADYPWVLWHYTLTGALMASLVYGSAGAVPWVEKLLANRAMSWLGLVSYSIYLWHYPVLEAVRRVIGFDAGRQAMAAAAAVAATLAVSWLSYRFVEAPFLREPAGGRAPS